MGIKKVLRDVFKRGSLGCFIGATAVILIEAAIPSDISASQSDSVAGIIQDEIDKNYDKDTIKDIKSFDITFENNATEYYVGDSLKYNIQYVPNDTSYKNLIWTTNDDSLVSLDTINNTIKFLKVGLCELTVKSEKNPKLTNYFTFKIKNIDVTSLNFHDESLNLNIGNTYNLNYEILPKNATNKKVIFESSHPDIVSINQLGTIQALKGGTSTITVSSLDNPQINDSLLVTVNEYKKIKVESITTSSSTLYAGQSLDIKGKYAPIDAEFDLNKLNIISDNSKVTIKKVKVDKGKGEFVYKVSAPSSITELTNVKLSFAYEELTSESNVEIKPTSPLNRSLIDEANLKTSLTGNVYYSLYYPSSPKYSDEITINIPYKKEVTGSVYKFKTSNYKTEVSKDIKIVSSSYNKIKVSTNSFEAHTSSLKYYFDKNDLNNFIEFNLNFEAKENPHYVNKIELPKLDSTNELIELKTNETYEDIFDANVLNEEGKAFATKGVNVTLDENSKSLASITYDKYGNALDLTTNNQPGTIKLIFTSKFEDDINFANKIKKTVELKISSTPNNSSLLINSKPTDNDTTLELKKHEILHYDLSFSNITTFADKSTIELLNDYNSYKITSSSDAIKIDEENKTIEGLKNGKAKITLTPLDTSLSHLVKEFIVIVNHTPISILDFNIKVAAITDDEFNKPNEDFSIIPINSEFKLVSEVNEDATDKRTLFKSSNPEIIEIDEITGQAVAKQIGTVDIISYSVDDPDIKVEKPITVVNTSSPFVIDQEKLNAQEFKEVLDENKKFSHYYIKLNYGKSYKLALKREAPATSTNFTFTYVDKDGNATNEDIVSIDNNGNISTKNVGNTWVKITYGDENANSKYSKYIEFNINRNHALTFRELALKVRKGVGHFGLFAATALCGLVFICLQFKSDKIKLLAMVPYAGIGFGVAYLSELIQKFTPGRCFTWNDILLDFYGFIGMTGAFIIGILIAMLVKFIIEKRNKKVEEKEPSTE